LVPVEGEPLGEPSVYGDDRLFVSLQLEDAVAAEVEGKLHALEEARHPVIRIILDDPLDLGQEFFRWEIATAVAGALLEIDPFDEPNVQESKDQTHRLLAAWRAAGIWPQQTLVFRENGISLYADAETLSVLNRRSPQPSLAGYLAAHLSQAQSGDYLALMAYLQRSAEHHATLQAMRVRLRERLRVATTLGYGPRFLHSTGQLHKGGANNGLFIQLTADDRDDLAIPGEPYTFSTLKQAQALGDFQALRNKGRRVIRVHLGVDVQAGLEQLHAAIAQAVSGQP
ncbi:MAG TPA: transaldolase, partial [Candidatus Tectomicrobia bacterium]